ncbi:BURP domain-containing protein BNM2A-like [Cucurbita pepo subsp. pepo]|uniref:BURP domain-containing protein BNM2A-like n=1 Tax=Cucurbita pepo subsp. pepo TaxID=3664 RepID=UPI000C9D2E43|nr:BURP domain-containing protein BNM2A-like [Cucurbita pepo subsp. pepo]
MEETKRMGSTRMASCFIFLLLLLPILKFTEGNTEALNESDEKKDPKLIQMVTKIDPKLIVFFTIDDLKQGKKLPIYFPKRDPSKSPPLFPKQTPNSIPFSLKNLPQILSSFSFPHASPQAQAIQQTLHQCELKPIKGETKFCATSMESMLAFVTNALATKPPFKLLKTSHLTNSNVHFQNYTFLEPPKKIAAPRLVACHTMPYPYAVYYCHYQEGDNNVLKIALEGDNGDLVEALAICHMDTSQWSPSHPSFRVLNIQPGSVPVCHFFPSDDLVWIPQG